MTKQIRLTALAVVGALGFTLGTPGSASAGSKGKQNTALVLGAVTAYGIVKKKPVIAGVAGAGALYSYVQSRKDASKERERKRLARARLARNRRVVYVSNSRPSRYASYGRRDCNDGPRGWSRGRKTGWNGRSVPPGHAKKRH